MDTLELMRAIADRIDANKEALKIEGVSYPPINTVPKSPWAMVRTSQAIPSTVEKARLGQQVWLPAIDVVVLVRSDVKRPADAARLDAVLTPLLDLFDASHEGGAMNTLMPGLSGHVDRVWNTTVHRIAPIEWGEAGYCFALIVTFDAKFRRSPEAIA